jgi:hypothetical protein
VALSRQHVLGLVGFLVAGALLFTLLRLTLLAFLMSSVPATTAGYD